MHLVGLTGGIGSGKSTVASRLAELGAHVIDADDVAREVVQPGSPVLAELAERFGDDVLNGDGALDRASLAARVFADDDERRALDAIMHPRIAGRIAEEIARLAGDPASPWLVVVDHPLLIETGQTARFDTVIVVIAPMSQRVARLVRERGMDETDVRRRMSAQTDDEQRRRFADHVIDNTGDIDQLFAQVDAVFAELDNQQR